VVVGIGVLELGEVQGGGMTHEAYTGLVGEQIASRLSSSEKPRQAFASDGDAGSRTTRPPSVHQSTGRPADRADRSITPSMISLPIHKTATGMSDRTARSARIAAV
jgi:hypothetical protein